MEIDRLHQEAKDVETRLSTEKLKFDYEKEELQKQVTQQSQLTQEAKRDIARVRSEMDKMMEEQEEEKSKAKLEMAALRDDIVSCRDVAWMSMISIR